MLSETDIKQIGKNLAQIRTQKNLSLETVADKTFISKRVLSAIERGKIKDLPEPFYTKALIEKYARSLGATEILSDIERIAVGQEDCDESQQPSNTRDKPTKNAVSTFQLKSSHLYLLYLVIVAIAVKTIAAVVEQPVVVVEPTEKSVVVEASDSDAESTPTTISSASPSQFVSQSSSNNAESVVVDILLKDRCWLKVMVDGKVEFEGTLAKGTQRSWEGKEQIDIIAGNAGGVVVTYNHGKEKLLGEPGEVEEVTYRRMN